VGHVRSWDTETPVGHTKREFEELIRRYGATGFTVSEDYASRTVVVAFSVKLSDGEMADVRLPLAYDTVKRNLFKCAPFATRVRSKGEEWADAQSARVAWRHLLLWAEASLAAVDAGLYSLQEAFFAHTMIATPNGGLIPAIDAVNAMKQITARSSQ
jgi:hypothetical protein